ncbi:hypothetical protein RDWZM_005329 [Blomia tropicalis]|uniref:Nanos-type domain-containing protein n=1 Tax=Blomia tropicalis TaxID=40697 RepID=A0A9Q0M5X6_BLOTA|nr:hypothetical protein RDWZM_005329 [Blomia tropicalis]
MSRLSTYATEFVPNNMRVLDFIKSTLRESCRNQFLPGSKDDTQWLYNGKIDTTNIVLNNNITSDFDNNLLLKNQPLNESTNFGGKLSTYYNSCRSLENVANVQRSFESDLPNYSLFNPVDNVSMPFAQISSQSNSIFSNVEPDNLDSNLRAIWSVDNFEQPLPQYGNLSFSSKSSSTNEDNTLKSSTTQANFIRAVMGRGPTYYQRYGTDCIAIPANSSNEFPFNWQIEATKPHERPSFGRKQAKNNKMECAFCKNIRSSDKSSENYKTHWLKNNQNVVTCPVLRNYQCPLCHNTNGDFAHTVRYCPMKRLKYAEDFKRKKNDRNVVSNDQAFSRNNGEWFYLNNVASSNSNGGHFQQVSTLSQFVNNYGTYGKQI